MNFEKILYYVFVCMETFFMILMFVMSFSDKQFALYCGIAAVWAATRRIEKKNDLRRYL